jgi:beta-phosphoglucomutase-like phosphatase (HAD superfamily)
MITQHFDALLFDCDGVLAETERDVHRISFNQAFKTKGLSNEWNVEKYGELLKIGGGKERMTAYFDEVGWPQAVSDSDRKSFIQELHLLKTENFNAVVESGAVSLRPGVMRLIDEAFAAGIFVAVCSTSNEAAVTTIVRTLLGKNFTCKSRGKCHENCK